MIAYYLKMDEIYNERKRIQTSKGFSHKSTNDELRKIPQPKGVGLCQFWGEIPNRIFA